MLKMAVIRTNWTGVGINMETKITRDRVRKQETPRNRPKSDHLAYRARLNNVSSTSSTSISGAGCFSSSLM